jgi:tetratricopeptide (TPR) repeat protein
MVAVATNDNAPLWLQEALAKHLETTWRAPRPHDGRPNLHEVARTAWLQGQSVGLDRLGASIALLPNPQAANIAYAEVYDFLDVVIRTCGWNAVKLLLREVRDLGGDRTDAALRSATGYAMQDWTRRWRHALVENDQPANAEAQDEIVTAQYRETARRLRLAELFASVDRFDAVESTVAPVLEQSRVTELRSLAGLAHLQQGSASAALGALGQAAALSSLQGEWLALRGRALAELGRAADAKDHLSWALANAPSDERIACEGFAPSRGDGRAKLGLALCSAASSLARSASEPLDP